MPPPLADRAGCALWQEGAQRLIYRAPLCSLSKVGIEREKAAFTSDRATLEKKAFEKYNSDGMGSEIRLALKALPHGEKPHVFATIHLFTATHCWCSCTICVL
jgi:hypothetical protein